MVWFGQILLYLFFYHPVYMILAHKRLSVCSQLLINTPQLLRKYLLPLSVKVVVDLLVGDGHHDDEDPQQHHAHQELVDHPHGHHRRLEVL